MSMMLHTYVTCKKCKSLFSPECSTCPICGAKVEEYSECHIYRIKPHTVCPNCGWLIKDVDNQCPVCDAKLNQEIKKKIVLVPVEL